MATIKSFEDFLDRMQGLLDNAKKQGHIIVPIEDLENTFPELKESDDEKTKRILHSISSKISFHLRDIFTEEEFQCFDAWSNAWLEKQGEQKPAWSEEDIMRIDNLIAIIENRGYPDYVEYLEKLKYRVQPKQEWSEEDEQLYNDLSDTYFYNDEDYPEETYKLMLKRVLDWMNKRAKSLKPQSQWKPSDEQLDALYDVLNPCDGVDKKALESLYEQLKAL